LVECPVECQYLTVLLTPKGYTFPERREGKDLDVPILFPFLQSERHLQLGPLPLFDSYYYIKVVWVRSQRRRLAKNLPGLHRSGKRSSSTRGEASAGTRTNIKRSCNNGIYSS
jgi:hypothetical protein